MRKCLLYIDNALGIAMGSKMSPYLSHSYKTCFENDYVSFENPFHNHIKLWKCYVADIFMVYDGLVDSLLRFYEYLNRCHEHLKCNFTPGSKPNSTHCIILKNAKSRRGTERRGVVCGRQEDRSCWVTSFAQRKNMIIIIIIIIRGRQTEWRHLNEPEIIFK